MRRALLGALVALALSGCGGQDSSSRAGAPSPSASAGSPSPSSTPGIASQTAPAEVADLVRTAATTPGTSTVAIQIGTQCTLAAEAVFGPHPSLVGTLDFRSGPDSDYVAEKGHVEVTVPDGEPFPQSGPTAPSNPWGPALSRIDPATVPLVISDHATGATATLAADGGTTYVVTLDGPATLADFGSDPNDDLPASVKYVVETDAQGTLMSLKALFGDYGADFVTFSDWRNP